MKQRSNTTRALDLIVELDGDSQRKYQDLSPREASDCAKSLFDAWDLVTNREPTIVATVPGADEDEKARNLRRLGLLLGSNLASALAAADDYILSTSQTPDDWFPYLQSTRSGLRGHAKDSDASIERSLLASYLDGRWNIRFMWTVGSAALGGTAVGWDKFVFWSIEEVNRIAASSGRVEHFALAVGMTLHLTHTARDGVDKRDRADFSRRESALGLAAITQELPLLASRNKTMQDRYGPKQVESRFEQQLGVLMQSFGYFTIPTVPGERRVDLICISATSSQEECHTILLEAKTTISDYGLPSDDSRAIEEYIRTARSNLNTTPRLKLLLIVGPLPKPTIESRLRQLEVKTSLPIRYCAAHLLARLRRALPGPVDADKLVQVLIAGPPVVIWDDLNRIVESDKRRRDAHVDFVSTMLRP